MSFDAFLKIDGAPGESTDAQHPNEIEILSYSFGLAAATTGSGKPQFQDLQFVARTQRSSPTLFRYCANGTHFKKATLSVRNQGADQDDYYMVTMETVFVTAFQQTGDAAGDNDGPLEQVKLAFGRVTIDYRFQNSRGALESVVVKWDVARNSTF